MVLLVLALPLQGLAAATMCHAAAVSKPASDNPLGSPPDTPHCPTEVHADSAASAGESVADTADADQAPTTTACSVCAACHAAGLPALPLPWVADTTQPAFQALQAAPCAVLALAGLERPPRSLQA